MVFFPSNLCYCFCTFSISFLDHVQPFWTPLTFRTHSTGTLAINFLNQPKSSWWGSSSTGTSHNLTPNWKKSIIPCLLCPWPPTVTSPLILLCSQTMSPVGHPPWLACFMCQGIIFHTLQETPRLILLCCVTLPAASWQAQVPHENKG